MYCRKPTLKDRFSDNAFVLDRLEGEDTTCIPFAMTKKLIRHGNGAALVLDKELLDLLKIQMDTLLEITTDGRGIIISPQNDENADSSLVDVLEKINASHGSVVKKLAHQGRMPRFLTLSEVLLILQDQIRRAGGMYGVRDLSLLSSALAMPIANFVGLILVA